MAVAKAPFAPEVAPNPAGSPFGTLPEGLAAELLESLNSVARNYREGRWETAELNGGKLCEVAYTICRGYADGGKYPAKASKPGSMQAACQALEKADPKLPRSIRIQIPRMLVALYEIRNNRNVGHVGSDVDPNHMDASAVLAMCKWVVAELVRVLHDVDAATAKVAVDALIERETPLVWSVAGKKRVLDTTLSRKDKMLLLLYSEPAPVSAANLAAWLEAPNAGYFKRDVVRPVHREKLIEFDETTGLVHLLPTGIRDVETRLLTAAILD